MIYLFDSLSVHYIDCLVLFSAKIIRIKLCPLVLLLEGNHALVLEILEFLNLLLSLFLDLFANNYLLEINYACLAVFEAKLDPLLKM